MTVNPNKTTSRTSHLFSKATSGLFLVAVVACGWLVIRQLNPSSTGDETADTETDAADETAADESEFTLPEAKVVKANFVTETSSKRSIEDVRTVSGRLTYDESRHIEIKAPVSGVLVDVLVKPGDAVAEGQLLAILNSPEIGKARASVLSEQSKLNVTVVQLDRLEEVTNNLRSLFAALDENQELNEIEGQFNDKSLGTYRQEIMAAYSERLLANQLAAAARPLVDSGSMPLRTLQERENNRHVADAKFRSVREITAYDIGIRKQQLEAEQRDGNRQVMIAQNHLTTLLGFADKDTAEATSESLSRMEVRAPFAGTVEERSYARRERVEQSDSLFVLANTESLYVSADIRENEWAAMSVQPGQEIEVVAPAIPDRTFKAKVHYIGRVVEMESNSLPLVATISNTDGLLRPGMFVRVAIPVAHSGSVVAVRSESVMQHENEKFVFVSLGDETFRRVDVQTGVHNEEWVEITEGLNEGEAVVAGGAFLLKSELLLAGEEE
ncbi:MAG: efflux RND transporter periplasmic adaptor subunit [Fuerstiella sp.]|jgi:membrane fusion protein, heavy metal efflux system